MAGLQWKGAALRRFSFPASAKPCIHRDIAKYAGFISKSHRGRASYAESVSVFLLYLSYAHSQEFLS
jgi:hypothetical protein